MSASNVALDLMPLAAPPESGGRPALDRNSGRARSGSGSEEPVVRRQRRRPLTRFAVSEESPSFYLSLSDLMSLLLVFFVLIFSLTDRGQPTEAPAQTESMISQAQAAAPMSLPSLGDDLLTSRTSGPDDHTRAVAALAGGGQGDPGLRAEEKPKPKEEGPRMDRALLSLVSSSATGTPSAVVPDELSLEELLDQVKAAASSGVPGEENYGGMQIAKTPDRLIIRLPEHISFDLGKARIKPSMADTLARLAPVILRNGKCRIIVTGHTDDLPISTPQFASNWELSAARAAAVARALTSQGVPARHMHIQGMADQAPLAPNSDEANRQRNRRVEIELRSIG